MNTSSKKFSCGSCYLTKSYYKLGSQDKNYVYCMYGKCGELICLTCEPDEHDGYCGIHQPGPINYIFIIVFLFIMLYGIHIME